MTSLVISSGHGKYIRGASGYPVPPQCDEVDEARKVVEAVATKLRTAGVTVKTFHDDTSHDQNTNLNTIVNYHNAQSRDLDVSVHFNAYDHSAHGCEVLYKTETVAHPLATTTVNAICSAGRFTNRGAKLRTDLFFLNKTAKPAILIETCFCDNTNDCNLYREYFDGICEAIAESIGGVSIPDVIPPEPEPEPVPPPEGESRVEINTTVEGDVTTYINGVMVQGHEGCEHVIRANIELIGDVVLVINGEEFHNTEPAPPVPDEGPPPNQCNIWATVFGGSSDPNDSAYPPYDPLNDTERYVALPWNVSSQAVRDSGVQVWNRANGKTAVGKIRDKGPWMVDDNYASAETRPIAETCFKNKTPLPSGPNKGKIPSNAAGIDLSPAMFEALGMTDNANVDWDFA